MLMIFHWMINKMLVKNQAAPVQTHQKSSTNNEE